MRTIKIQNPVLNTYITDLGANYSSGTSLTVRSNNSFAANDLIVVGNPTEELTEGKKVSAISGTTILTLASALNFSHNKSTPVYKTKWDFVSIEGRSTSAGVFAELTQSPIQWDSKTNKTIYDHTSGTDSWEYRFRFYNSVLGIYSEYSPTLSGIGFLSNQMGYIIREARRIAGDKAGKIMTTEECLRALTRAKNIIRAHNPRYWFWKVDGIQLNTPIAAIADTSLYSLGSLTNFGTIGYIEYKYSSGNTIRRWVMDRKNDKVFKELTSYLNRPSHDFPHIYHLLPPDSGSANGYFELEAPIQTTGVGNFYVTYYKNESTYNSVDDSTAIIMPEILEDYLISEIYATKGNDAMKEKYYSYFTGPQSRKKTMGMEDLTGISLLDELDRQYKTSEGEPKFLVQFRGQRGATRNYGKRYGSADYYRENFFEDEI